MKYVSMALMLTMSLLFQGCAHHGRVHDSYSHPVIVRHEITPQPKHNVRVEHHAPKHHVQHEKSSYKSHVHKPESMSAKHFEGNRPHRHETSLKGRHDKKGSKNCANLPHRG